jgi:response regulator RpfG family c-di-GMP phosphodiesterase
MDTLTLYATVQGSVEALTMALHVRDNYTRFHCDRVVTLAKELAEARGVSTAELDTLHMCALFHDIGKIGIPDCVLLKPGRLDPDEWAVMKTHSALGESLFRSAALDCVGEVAPVIRHHHEAFDGSGYPDGLDGERIPLLSRILLIADAYDAMASTRPYHQTRPHGEIMAVLRSESGHKFDPDIFRTFSKLIGSSVARVH